MSFLDNGGSLILDAVLTDTGRQRLARGDGSFRIVKFAVCDDEINYTTYNGNHASGSAYYDLTIMQSPIFEAFTNNEASMISKLITIPRTNLLYLPILKLNEVFAGSSTARHSTGAFLVACDENTEKTFALDALHGWSTSQGNYIRVDQGLDTTEKSPQTPLDPDLYESQYMLKLDNRFGKIASVSSAQSKKQNAGNTKNSKVAYANVSYIDDDNIAYYLVNLGTDPSFVKNNDDTTSNSSQVIRGPRGTYLQFGIASSAELATSNAFFTTYGSTTSITPTKGIATTVKYIDDVLTVEGATTGSKIDIPIRFIKI